MTAKSSKPHIRRHRTAINRTGFSLPIRKALEGGLINSSTSVFDYGCGKGEDVHRLHKIGIEATGWDPVHRPEEELSQADIVNLGYVLNVIETAEERVVAVQRAWSLAKVALLVSTRSDTESHGLKHKHLDGYLTGHQTFQKFYSQSELKALLSISINQTPLAVAPGVFFAFKSDQAKLSFLAKSLIPTEFSAEDIRLEYGSVREELVPHLKRLREFFTAHGRLPTVDDWPEDYTEFLRHFGSTRRALSVIRRAESDDWYEDIIQSRKNDLLILLVRMLFESRPRFSHLPSSLQRDIRALFSSYKKACAEADSLLFSAGEMSLITAACDFSEVGKRTRSAIYVHKSALDSMPPVLRAYEICARVVAGEIPEANIIKLSTLKPHISYLAYPDFDSDPHPSLTDCFLVDLRAYYLKHRSYSESGNPPILHRKELLVADSYPRRATFARLSLQEKRHGLLNHAKIGTVYSWKSRLRQLGLDLRGHRLIKLPTE